MRLCLGHLFRKQDTFLMDGSKVQRLRSMAWRMLPETHDLDLDHRLGVGLHGVFWEPRISCQPPNAVVQRRRYSDGTARDSMACGGAGSSEAASRSELAQRGPTPVSGFAEAGWPGLMCRSLPVLLSPEKTKLSSNGTGPASQLPRCASGYFLLRQRTAFQFPKKSMFSRRSTSNPLLSIKWSKSRSVRKPTR